MSYHIISSRRLGLTGLLVSTIQCSESKHVRDGNLAIASNILTTRSSGERLAGQTEACRRMAALRGPIGPSLSASSENRLNEYWMNPNGRVVHFIFITMT